MAPNDSRGVPSSGEKLVVEGYTLINDGNAMPVEYLFEDPVYLTEPVEMSSTFFVDPDYPRPELRSRPPRQVPSPDSGVS